MSEIAWEFATQEFTVRLRVEDEDMDPADCFECEEHIEAVRNGDVTWFYAVVEVLKNGKVIGSDSLGCCAYNSVKEFISGHRDRDPMNRNCSIMRQSRGENVCIGYYFPDMVRQAIADARTTLQ